MITKMKVDGYLVGSQAIADVIEKLTEADGSATNRLGYMIEAVRMLAEAIADEAAEEKSE